MDSSGGLDSRDRKVREDSLDLPDCLLFLFQLSVWTKGNQEPPEQVVYRASPGPEVTKVFRVYLVVRVCLDFLVLLSRVKDSLAFPVIPGSLDFQVSLDQREKLESWDFLAHLAKGVTKACLVSLETLERLVDLAVQVSLEIASVILEDQELKAYQESQASQVAAVMTVPPVTAAFQEVQVSQVPRGVLGKEGVLESTELLVSLGQRVRLDSPVEVDRMGLLVSLVVLVDLDQKVCLDLPVWTD